MKDVISTKNTKTENYFGLVSDEGDLVTARIIALADGYYSPEEIADKLGRMKTSMLLQTLHITDEYLRDYISPLVRVTDLAYQTCGEMEQTRKWVMTPNPIFMGRSPFSMCLMGEGSNVINHLMGEEYIEAARRTPKQSRGGDLLQANISGSKKSR